MHFIEYHKADGLRQFTSEDGKEVIALWLTKHAQSILKMIQIPEDYSALMTNELRKK